MKLVAASLILIGVMVLGVGGLNLKDETPVQGEQNHPKEDVSVDAKKNPCNHLGAEKSPYLLQHQNNPVCWYAWGEEAFKAAKEQNKPIFLSIGYSTCYWCHVMEKDSFELQEVADVLNKYFISIKVDREERPDVDQIYMDAVVSLTGRGGWPMSVFLTPDQEPFWGGTFFYRKKFIQILENINEQWGNDKEKLLQSAAKITKFIEQKDVSRESVAVGEEELRSAYRSFAGRYDPQFGGFGRAPKFPPSMQVSLLLRLHERSGDKKALEMASDTLEKMARAGLFDHLGGGFHRYSTDEKWIVPHFVKMLYDNALLAFTYLEAHQLTKKPVFAEVSRETLDYVLREMTSPEGGFYSAQDAGEVGKEGEFYVWKESELQALLTSEEAVHAKKIYGVTAHGNFEHGTTILTLQQPHKWSVKKDALTVSIHKKLLAARNKREHPHKDDKVLTGWNGLMISAFAKGYQVLGDKRYLAAAQKSARFMQEKLFVSSSGLFRRYRDGEAKVQGFVEDYAYFIEGLLHLYESDFDEKWLQFAVELQKLQDQKFWDEDAGGYYYTEAKDVIVRKKDYIDNAIPSGNSVALLNLLRLYGFFLEKEYIARAEELLSSFSQLLHQHPTAFPRALQAVDFHMDRAKEIAVIQGSTKEAEDKIKEYVYKTFLPNKVLSVGAPSQLKSEKIPTLLRGKPTVDGKTTIYVCENNTCKLPTGDVEKAKGFISDHQKLTL